MKVRWSTAARAELRAIITYIADDNPFAAARVRARIHETAEALERMPDRGRPGGRQGTRELVILGTPYLLVYAVSGGGVTIASVIHGARNRD